MVNATAFAQFGCEIILESGTPVCSGAGLTTTGSYRARPASSAPLAVTDQGVLP